MRTPLALALTLVLAVAALSATVVIPTGFREVVTEATIIVRGRVTDVRAVGARGREIDSVGTVAVAATLKGPITDFVSVRVPGGQIGRDRFVVVGAPRLSVGQQAVFFLKRGSDNALRPVGLTAGIYRLQAEPITGRPMVDPPLLVGRTASEGTVVRGDVRRAMMPVQEFESLVRLVIAGQTGAASSASSARGGR